MCISVSHICCYRAMPNDKAIVVICYLLLEQNKTHRIFHFKWIDLFHCRCFPRLCIHLMPHNPMIWYAHLHWIKYSWLQCVHTMCKCKLYRIQTNNMFTLFDLFNWLDSYSFIISSVSVHRTLRSDWCGFPFMNISLIFFFSFPQI